MAKKEVITPAGFAASGTPVTRHQSWRYRLRLGASGSPPDDGPDGQRYSRADPQLFGTHQAILEAAGTSLGNVVSATCWLSSRENFAAFNEVYASYFPTDKPVRATVEANLMAQGALVEIMVTACMD